MLSPAHLVAWINRRRQVETLDTIAESLGVSRAAMLGWCNGTRNPSRTVLLLAELLMPLSDQLAEPDGRR